MNTLFGLLYLLDNINYYNNQKNQIEKINTEKETKKIKELVRGEESLLFTKNDSLDDLIFVLRKSFPFYHTRLTKKIIKHIVSKNKYPFYFTKKEDSILEWCWSNEPRKESLVRKLKYYT